MRAGLFAVGLLLMVVALLEWPRVACAGEPQQNDPLPFGGHDESMLRLAQVDDDALAFASALARYEDVLKRDPTNAQAAARAATLRAHAEGGFAPYAALEGVRRDPQRASDAQAIDALVREAESFPRGLVRLEVWVLAAEAYAQRLGRPADAEPLLERIVVDPLADHVVAQKAAHDLVALRVARKDLASAADAVRLAGDRADASLARDVQRRMRRRFMHHASIALLLALALFAGRAGMSALRRGDGARMARALTRSWKLSLGFAAWVAFGGVLAAGYEDGTSTPFLWFGAALAPLLLIARAWGAAGSEGRAPRLGRASLCAAGAASAAFLVLETIDVAFLSGLGL